MRGYQEFNFPAFDAMAERLRRVGVEPVSPADNDRKLEQETSRIVKDLTIEECMERDIVSMRDVDGIMLLAGWGESKGAMVEVAYARYRSIPIFQETEFNLFLNYLQTFDKELIA